RNLEEPLQKHIDKLLGASNLEKELTERFKLIGKDVPSLEIGQFRLGFLTRFLFSALIDADRLNSAGREPASGPDWPLLIDILEANLAGFTVRNRIDEIRAE